MASGVLLRIAVRIGDGEIVDSDVFCANALADAVEVNLAKELQECQTDSILPEFVKSYTIFGIRQQRQIGIEFVGIPVRRVVRRVT